MEDKQAAGLKTKMKEMTCWRCTDCGLFGSEEGRVSFFMCGTCSKRLEMAVIPSWVVEELSKPTSEYLKRLGHHGGIIGGPARAKSLSAKRRKEIASNAAKERWTSERREVVDPLKTVTSY